MAIGHMRGKVQKKDTNVVDKIHYRLNGKIMQILKIVPCQIFENISDIS